MVCKRGKKREKGLIKLGLFKESGFGVESVSLTMHQHAALGSPWKYGQVGAAASKAAHFTAYTSLRYICADLAFTPFNTVTVLSSIYFLLRTCLASV